MRGVDAHALLLPRAVRSCVAPHELFQGALFQGGIEGTLSCLDRLIFRGYLPVFGGYAMAASTSMRSPG